MNALARVTAQYAAASGYPDFLSLATARIASGASVEAIARELRPLFASRNWPGFPNRRTLNWLLNHKSTPAPCAPPAREQLSAARRQRTVAQRQAAREARRTR